MRRHVVWCISTQMYQQPAEEEVYTDDEENRYLLNVCVKVKNGELSAGK